MFDPDKIEALIAAAKGPVIAVTAEQLRQMAGDPDSFWAEYEADMQRFDDGKIVADCDPRRVTQVGNATDPRNPNNPFSNGDDA